MKLTEFICTEMDLLLDNWEVAAVEIAPDLKGQDSRVLRDHARDMLEFIIADLTHAQTKEEAANKALGRGPSTASDAGEQHGSTRLDQGLSLIQTTQELRALRARVTSMWADHLGGLQTDEINELVRFNESIDQLIFKTITSYTTRRTHAARLFEAMLRASPDPSAIFDPDGRLLFLNSPMADLITVTGEDATGRTPMGLGLSFAPELGEAIAETVSSGQPLRREFRCRAPSGQELYLDCQLVPVFDEQQRVEAVAKSCRDVTERKQAEYRVWRSANFDTLTGIPNRRLFLDRLEQNLLEAERKSSSFALMFIDLDRFKQANDELGHEAGDRLLELVAERISTSVRAMDTVARLGGDEFTVILKDATRDDAVQAAKTLLASLEQPFQVGTHRLHISASIGLTLYPEDGRKIDKLMHNADQAMYVAKENGGHQCKQYLPAMARRESEHMRLNRELDDALREDQLEVYYQPIIDLRSGAICRAEALLRWNHPYKGLLTPASFLTIAEQSGMTDSVNAYVLKQAVACSLRWRDDSDAAFPININESPASFFTRTLMDQWQERLGQGHLDRSSITMELTPASLANIRASGYNPVRSLGGAGLRLHLAIDDFGIAPFSPIALQACEVDSVKVNRELIKQVGKDRDANRIVEGIIAMAHAMQILVVAEGVEKNEQKEFLARAGCDFAQGFLFSRPLPSGDFEKLLMRDRQ